MNGRAVLVSILFVANVVMAQQSYIGAQSTGNGDIGLVVGTAEQISNKLENNVDCTVRLAGEKNGNFDGVLRYFGLGNWKPTIYEATFEKSQLLSEQIIQLQQNYTVSSHDGDELCQSAFVFETILSKNEQKMPKSAWWKANTKPFAHVTYTCAYACESSTNKP